MTVERGALALMMLKTLEVLVPLHGYGIARASRRSRSAGEGARRAGRARHLL